eukprot:CAMPEP_0203877106 /NCGR_PEP_ID=MMETSP0359-20131031/21761_1 /ASSEMBLY_ACC=CAM_ASM_000338 /TAXON_ID=268821 /ORGANISM="Scrippsiella Hangoei, Strain SHTV-5" /LENGTH=178 /DNA_ID=CAMNT_0050796015 /DNA_START=678 /DNA_END=1211 /DNA_ORIENTATION=-
MSAGLRSSCSHPDCRANIIIDEGDRDWHWSISLGEKLQCCPTDEDGEVPAVVEGVRGSGNLSAKQSRMTPSGLLPPPQPCGTASYSWRRRRQSDNARSNCRFDTRDLGSGVCGIDESRRCRGTSWEFRLNSGRFLPMAICRKRAASRRFQTDSLHTSSSSSSSSSLHSEGCPQDWSMA